MKMLEAYEDVEDRKIRKELTKKRFACAHCGNTWIELVGLVVWHKGENEDVCLQAGMESENCQTCRFRSRECQKCGSNDVYEIRFLEEIPEGAPLSFKYIKRVSRE